MKYLQLFFLIIATSFTTSAQLVVQVYDGDTYRIFHQGKFQIIRLANVDAPELSQYYGRLVKTEVSKLILTKVVRIQVYGKDRYGRTVAKIIVAGKSLLDGPGIGSSIRITKLYLFMNGLLLKLATECGSVNTMCLHGYGEN